MTDWIALGAYRKRPLREIYSSWREVPDEFLLEWYEELLGAGRPQDEESLLLSARATPAERMSWLTEALEFQWAVMRSRFPGRLGALSDRRSAKENGKERGNS